ncbi:MAG: hypothetical protein MUF79_13550 [Burkholderiales bacterium]|jgi:hypothetical protein|nr:hypothetical protein [Burkholderiales bacterium]
MTSDRLTEKERAVVEAAKRDAATRRAALAEAAKGASQSASGRASPRVPAATPLDQPTVLGWDHPAANPKPAASRVDARTLASWETGPMALSATTPLDQPTVLGWDNPAAQDGAAAAKWERIANLMAEERETAEAQRRKVKQYGLAISAALFAVGMLVVLALWPRPGG